MYKIFTTIICALLSGSASWAQYASQTFGAVKNTDRTLYFDTNAPGQKLPILWGLDTAWPDEGNIIRGVRFIGAENIGVARVSFQPWDYMPTTTLTSKLEANLVERLRLVSIIGGPGKVKLVLNNDGPLEECDNRYFYPASNPDACKTYCNLIYGTTLSCQNKGWEVITASPLNEPDYVWNGQGSKDDFLAIAKMLKSDYPQYKDGSIRISGGNTLNCDQAEPWYTYLYDYIDEGNTHQLAGDFNHYAEFFAKVRADGKYATADELHNVMEAMVGVEYGMQTGIWWGTAELARGEFCKASFGERLAYSENRKAWSSAAVYRAPDGKIQGFVGQSERQADVCTYRFVSQDRDIFYNGHGPQREYVVDLPGGVGYQLPTQTSAEYLIDITWGEDVSPVIDGTYMIMNKSSKKVLGAKGQPANSLAIKQYSISMASVKNWEVKPAPITIGGDYSYYTIKIADLPQYKLDVNNWSLQEGGSIIIYDGALGNNEQWYLKYAGDGCFRIFSRHSGLCLQLATAGSADGIDIVQAAPSDTPTQLWRLIPTNAMCELVAPAAPTALSATANSASITLTWTGSTSTDVEQYYVVRAEGSSTEYTTVGRGFKETTFTDNTVRAGVKYTYKVKAIDRAYNSSEYTAVASAQVEPGFSLVGRWIFDNSLSDETDNHFDASVYAGARTMYATSREGNKTSLNLASNRFVQLPYQVTNHSDLTVGAWIKWTSSGGEQTLISFGSDADNYLDLHITPTGTLELTDCYDGEKASISGGAIAKGEWQHVALTVSKTRAAVFIDGKLVAQGAGCDIDALSPVLNYVGTGQDRKETYLNAQVEDLCIYRGIIPDRKISSMMDGIVGVTNPIYDGEVETTEYYNMLGVRVPTPGSGMYIVKRAYTSGSVLTTKEYLR